MTVCHDCGGDAAHKATATGRTLCESCWSRFVGLAAAGSAMVTGEGAESAVGAGIAAAGFASILDAEADAARAREAKLAATEGFWRRLWVRVVG